MAKINLGLIGIVHEEAKRDYWGTMQKVAAAGYRGIEGAEGALLQGDVAANLAKFRELGLTPLCVSASREGLRDNLPKLIANAKALETKRVSCWWGPVESREQVLKDAELYNAAGAKLAAEGLKLCYHNHDHEFRNSFNGVCALDILAGHTDPKNVYFELDIAWITVGGDDPARVLRRYAGRVPAIHVKDVLNTDSKPQFTALGTGIVKIKEGVQAAIDTGVEWAVAEQDKLRNLSAMETITISALYLKEAGLV